MRPPTTRCESGRFFLSTFVFSFNFHIITKLISAESFWSGTTFPLESMQR